MIEISKNISIPKSEVELTAVRSQGAGGQNVNKVATAIHLRFDVDASSLPENIKEQLLALKDRRISKEGIVIIKAQKYRTQEKNREDAYNRLRALIQKILVPRKKRKPTKPTHEATKKRLDNKSQKGKVKKLRGKVIEED